MYQVNMQVRLKKELNRKSTYEKTAALIRLFIDRNDKELKKNHYEKMFSYYSFSNFHPLEKDGRYPKGNVYTVEIRTLHKEFLDMKQFKGLETDELTLEDVNAGPLFYGGRGVLETETPVYFKTKRIVDAAYEEKVKERIRENMLFRYVKSGINASDDLDALRTDTIKSIAINPKVITIPFESKRLNDGNALLYHCFHARIEFQDNPVAKDVEKVVYGGGLGLNTSNGFGFLRQPKEVM